MYPAGVPGILFRPVTVTGNVELRVLESGPVDGRAVFLVHGFGASAYTFAEMLPVLAAHGYRVIAVELPGHGLSKKPHDETMFSVSRLGDALLEVASALGVREFTIVGHSMGGGIALDLALRGERCLTGAVLINPVGLGKVFGMGLLKLFSPRPVNRVAPALLTRWTIIQLLRMAFAVPGRPTERDIDEYWAPTQFPEFAHACRACVHHYRWSRVRGRRLRELRLPMLVITGERDLLVRGAAQRAALIPSARVVRVPDGGHLVLQECSTITNAEILKFLRDG